jgi:hypothetical protein
MVGGCGGIAGGRLGENTCTAGVIAGETARITVSENRPIFGSSAFTPIFGSSDSTRLLTVTAGRIERFVRDGTGSERISAGLTAVFGLAAAAGVTVSDIAGS